MADLKISALTGATTPLAGTEVLPVVQSSTTKQVSVANLTAGRAVSALSFTGTNDSSFNGVTVGRGTASVGGNTALGASSLLNVSTGGNVTGAGANASRGNTSGANNSSFGADSGYAQQTGSFNTLLGSTTGTLGTAFSRVTAVGYRAGRKITGDGNTFVGADSGLEITSGTNHSILGSFDGSTGLNITTANGYVVLSNGVGTIAAYNDTNNWVFPSGNLVPSTAAKGINFTANTPAAGMTSQLLNWYEEGTFNFSVTFNDLSVGITYSDRKGRYTRIGRMVFVSGIVALTSKGSSTGNARITGLPFTINGDTSAAYAPPSLLFSGITFAGQYSGLGEIGTTGIRLWQTSILGVLSGIADTNFANDSQLFVSFAYSI